MAARSETLLPLQHPFHLPIQLLVALTSDFSREVPPPGPGGRSCHRESATIGGDRTWREMTMRRHRPSWPGYATIPDAIRYLASACDGAIRRDGHGFSAEHVAVGHWLANEPDAAWTRHHLRIGRHRVAVYGRQLQLAGFDTGAILRNAPRPRRRSRDYEGLIADWAPDPTGLWPYRWWNGVRWTCHTLGPRADRCPPIGVAASPQRVNSAARRQAPIERGRQ